MAILVILEPAETVLVALAATPCRESKYLRKRSVGEPGEDTATVVPRKSSIEVIFFDEAGEGTSAYPG